MFSFDFQYCLNHSLHSMKQANFGSNKRCDGKYSENMKFVDNREKLRNFEKAHSYIISVVYCNFLDGHHFLVRSSLCSFKGFFCSICLLVDGCSSGSMKGFSFVWSGSLLELKYRTKSELSSVPTVPNTRVQSCEAMYK